MDISQLTHYVDESCTVFCRSQANLILRVFNPNIEAQLLKVYDEDDDVYFVWADLNQDEEEVTFCPVFAGEEDYLPPMESYDELEVGSAFCHGENLYVVTQNNVGDIVIRGLEMISNENLLRKMLTNNPEDAEIDGVYLSLMYEIENGKQFVTMSWCVSFDDESLLYIPVLEEDLNLVTSDKVEYFLREPVKEGMPVKMHNFFYTPLKDENGEWHIVRSKSPLLMPSWSKN